MTAGASQIVTLALDEIRLDGGTQPRAVLDFDAIEAFEDALRAGAKFPPMEVFYDGESYWLADGFHRRKAALGGDMESFPCHVHQGTVEDARWFSFSVNQTNGIYRSNADKQRAVKAALQHPKAKGMSDRAIAQHVGVDHKTVADYREKLNPSGEIPQIRTVTRKGRTYQQDTTRIGKAAVAAKPEPSRPISIGVRQSQRQAAHKDRMERGMGLIEGAITGMIQSVNVGFVRAACTEKELATWQRAIEVFRRQLADFGGKLGDIQKPRVPRHGPRNREESVPQQDYPWRKEAGGGRTGEALDGSGPGNADSSH